MFVMAGRRANIQTPEAFNEFINSIPETARNQGYWRIKFERTNDRGGVISSFIAYIPFESQESYEELRTRVKVVADNYGPGVYFAIACDDRKTEIKNLDQAKFTFMEDEVAMPPPPAQKEPDALRDPMATVKKTQKDLLEMKALEAQSKIFESMMKGKPEEEEVKETVGTGGNLEQLMMMKYMFGDEKKKEESDVRLLEARVDAKLGKLEALLEGRHKGNGDDKVERLLERLIDEKKNEKSENAFSSMLTMMMKQSEDRERERLAEERRRETERAEERSRIAEQMRLEREKFEKELTERQRRFDEELKLRREELKTEAEKARSNAAENSKVQLQLFDILKNAKDSSLETTNKIVDTVVGAGMTSMKTAREAADCIMSIAKKADRDEKPEKDEGIAGILKDLGQIAGPILAPYADVDAKLKMLKSVQGLAGAGGLGDLVAKAQAPQPGANVAAPSAAAQAPQSEGIAHMITTYLQKFPILKDALIGNLRDGLGVELYLPIILGLDQPTLEGLIANVPHTTVMGEVKRVCASAEERALIDQNVEWFVGLRRAMIEELRANLNGEDEEDVEEGEVEEDEPVVASTPPPAPVKPPPPVQPKVKK